MSLRWMTLDEGSFGHLASARAVLGEVSTASRASTGLR
jgi:hypothetical protein